MDFVTVRHMKLCAKLDMHYWNKMQYSQLGERLPHQPLTTCLPRWLSLWLGTSLLGCSTRFHPMTPPISHYVDNISANLDSETKLFADHCTLYHAISCIKDCISLQNDKSKIYKWYMYQTWQLSLNITKCKVLCISNKRSPPTYTYVIKNTSLELGNKIK